ncbi:MAG: diguanylate phosphodiesterase [SAR86 cluster bacterium]|uniref:Diguanylate phosphodiesterase n=1 Tax=SAR86 cluster bacterium TaxID=2030880 RepID=A0A2A4XFD9_9GAMM|nr:MAG: diguanylate phosphodiesterase [SAR86 cluster bacterium]
MIDNITDLSIMVVDDEPVVLNMAVRILEKLGFTKIDTATNGNIALGRLVTSDPPIELIICDLNMPEMDGVEFMRHAHESGFSGGLILFSGEDTRLLDSAFGLGKAHDLNLLGAIKKPLKPDELITLIKKYEPLQTERRLHAPEKPISESDLRDGIKGSGKNQPLLVYQPKVCVSSGEIVGVETLCRWWNIDRGVLPPGAFIPLAEELGLIDKLTNEIYKLAITQLAEWNQHGRTLKLAVNFSVNSFAHIEFGEFLIETVKQHGVDSGMVILEVTETQTMNIEVNCLETLLSLRLKGFGLSIDDFGTGNSSLAQLKAIPFTEMKIDRAFVAGATNDTSTRAILESSVSLAKKMQMKIVAEGAESREDWDLVEELDCDYVQGFYCAKPMRNEDLISFLDSWDGPH